MKKVRLLIVAILLIVVISSISGTFARYYTKTKYSARVEAANWLIKVNKQDITTDETKNFSIGEMTFSEMSNAADKKFCPGRELSFTIAIDGSESMVSMEYILDLDLSNFNDPNIVATVTSDYDQLVHNDNSSTYSGKMRYKDSKEHIAILTVKLKWLDNEEHLEEDAALGSIVDNSIVVPVNVKVNQYTGV